MTEKQLPRVISTGIIEIRGAKVHKCPIFNLASAIIHTMKSHARAWLH